LADKEWQMDVVQEPGKDVISSAKDLLGHALQGARANSRPDLIRRLRRAQHTLNEAAPGDSADAIRLAAQDALRAFDSLEVDLRTRRETLSDRARTARLRAELTSVQARADQLKLVSREWAHTMSYGFSKVSSDAEFDLRTRVRALVAEAELAVYASEPRKDRAQLDAVLRGHLVTEADLSYQRVHHGVRGVAASVAARLELPIPHRVPAMPVSSPSRLVAELPDRYRPSPARPLPARLLTVMLPGYSGIVITLLFSRLLGVPLPAWLIAVCALAAAIALGAAKASGERKRELDRRRAEVMKGIRSTADEFQLVLAKQIRDAVLALQHDLRHATTARLTELGSAIEKELDTVNDQVKIAGRAPAELAAIAEDLESIAGLRNQAVQLRGATPDEPRTAPAPRGNLSVVA
jgi:gas vesicle protein